MTIATRPPARRLAAAFVLTPLVPSFGLALLGPFGDSPPWATQVLMATLTYAGLAAWPLTLLFGVPAYLLLRRRVPLTAFGCAAAGIAVVALPWLAFRVVLALAIGSDGWGWESWWLGSSAALGGLGGLAFWLMAADGTSTRSNA